MKNFSLVIALTALVSIPSYAAVYKCTINGVATFSQLPCGKDAQVINVRASKAPASDEQEKPDDPNSEVDTYITKRNIDRRIAMHEHNIKSFEERMRSDLDNIDGINQATANYLGANSIDEAKKKQADVIRSNYSSLIEREQKVIQQLKDEKAKIDEAAKSN
ncbi:DUF4124 domain-containing protein [Pseudoalteromonas sp. SSDWG2]|uniref:DUF4124 domain-containing protein n=1 Tax=Pseudoalteromonas sp. SSDWG2 TaxID=3139391 RepID=UPI003BA9C938